MKISEDIFQKNAVQQLEKALEENKLAHAYLFLGDEGVGKVKTALHLAMTLNCLNAKPNEYCGECRCCKKIMHNNHPDIDIIGPDGSTIKIEQIRILRNKVQLKSYEGQTKVIIIKDAHLLTPEAANSLLKILEEPPQQTLFILTAPEALRILPTILSRCQNIQFKKLQATEICKNLLAQGIERDTAEIFSNLAKGSLGKAYELMNNPEILLIRKKTLGLLQKLPKIKQADIFLLSDIIDKDKELLQYVFECIIYWFRDLAIIKTIGQTDQIINQDYLEVLKTNQLSQSDSIVALELSHKGLKEIEKNANGRLALEVLFFKIKGLYAHDK